MTTATQKKGFELHKCLYLPSFVRMRLKSPSPHPHSQTSMSPPSCWSSLPDLATADNIL